MLRSLFFLLVLAGPAAAQAPLIAPTEPTSAPLLPAPPVARTAADTIQAIHRLYLRHRRFGTALTFGAIAADFAMAGISAAQETRDENRSSGGSGYGNFGGNEPLLHFGFGGFAIIYGIIAAPVAAVGIQQLITYGPRHEAKVLAQYKEMHTLPKRVSKKLRRYLR